MHWLVASALLTVLTLPLATGHPAAGWSRWNRPETPAPQKPAAAPAGSREPGARDGGAREQGAQDAGLQEPEIPTGGPHCLGASQTGHTGQVSQASQTGHPDPSRETADWEARSAALTRAVRASMKGFPGRYSVVVYDLSTGGQWAHRPEERYHPASTIKMPVTLYALEQCRAGKLRWDDPITYTPADFESPGGGAFETAPFGGQYPVENLVNRALKYSNNVAVNMLGRRLGWGNIRAWTRTIDGELYQGPEVTPLSALGWWRHLYRLSQEEPMDAALIIGPLRQVAYQGRIPAGLPAGVDYLHKFGSYNGHFHDTGIVFAERPYVLVVMTAGASVDQADQAIAGLSAAVYRVMTADLEDQALRP